MYYLQFYVPPSHLKAVKIALFAAGAGKIGAYDQCAWQTLGEGQYRPLPGSQPFAGTQDQLCHEAEYKVEMVCAEAVLSEVISALKASHPYEQPAYWVMKGFPANGD
ncbi:MAG: NGG1p interacting factor NIF3 [Gammaproteobacteria bacterium]